MAASAAQAAAAQSAMEKSKKGADAALEPRDRYPRVFKTDKEIGSKWYYRLFSSLVLSFGQFVHGFTVKGAENIPKSGAALIIGIHSTHNLDFMLGLAYAFHAHGRVVRAMLHMTSSFLSFLTNRFGGAPGDRELALELLRQGNLVGIIPGGLEETYFHLTENGADAYTPLWETKTGAQRYGFARIAVEMGPGFKVLPVMFENGEEMRWSPVFALWTFLRLDCACGCLQRTAPRPLASLLYYAGVYSWVIFSSPLLSFTVPVKVTGHVAEAVVVREGETGATVPPSAPGPGPLPT